jgi:hypothetical protein
MIAEAYRVLRPGGVMIMEFTQMAAVLDEGHDYFRFTQHPAYYRINRTDLPGSLFFVPDQAELPRLPGYVAVSATILSGVYAEGPERQFYEGLKRMTPVVTIGHSIHVYRVDRPWW